MCRLRRNRVSLGFVGVLKRLYGLLVLGFAGGPLAWVSLQPEAQWQPLISGVPVADVRVAQGRAWAVVCGGSPGSGALITTEVPQFDWGVVACARHYQSLAVVGTQAWLAGGWGEVTIVRYDHLGIDTCTLPPARYTEARGYDARTREKMLRPQQRIQGIAAGDRYLWAWYDGAMAMMTALDRPCEWRPHSYATQFCDASGQFFPGPGWAWHEWLVCVLMPPTSEARLLHGTLDWPVRIGVLSARDPAHGRRLQPPPSLAGYLIRSVAVESDRVWIVGENEGHVKGFVGPRWALMTITLPGFVWQVQPTPAEFQQWERPAGLEGWLSMAVEGPNVVFGSKAGGRPGEGDLVALELDRNHMVPLVGVGHPAVKLRDLALRDGTVWVAHDEGLSRIRLPE